MKKNKISGCKVISYNRYSNFEVSPIFFANIERASNYIEFMKKYDPDSKEGYVTYKIEKVDVYLTEDEPIIVYLKNRIQNLEAKLNYLQDSNRNKPTVNYDRKEYEECERQIVELEYLLKTYKEKFFTNLNESKDNLSM